MKITVHVTQEDIDNGIKRNCTRCPVAMAISRQLGIEHVYVGSNNVIERVYVGANHATFGSAGAVWLPEQAAEFISKFDNPFASFFKPLPFSFELEVPDAVLAEK